GEASASAGEASASAGEASASAGEAVVVDAVMGGALTSGARTADRLPAAAPGRFDRSDKVAELTVKGSLKAYGLRQEGRGTVKAEVSLKAYMNGQSGSPLLNLGWSRTDEPIDLSEAEAALEGATEGSSTTLSVNLDATLTTTFNISLAWRLDRPWWSPIPLGITVERYKMWMSQDLKERLDFAATGQFRSGMTPEMAAADAPERARAMKELAEADPVVPQDQRTIPIGHVWFMVGPVPVYISFDMVTMLAFGAFADLYASGSQVFSASYDLGFAYEDGRWRPINSFRIRQESVGGQFDFTALLSAMPYLRFRAMLYGAAGLTLDLTVLLELAAEASGGASHVGASESGQGSNGAEASWSAALDLYLMGAVGAEIDFWGLNKHWNSKEIVLAERTLKEWSGQGCVGDACADDEPAAAEPAEDQTRQSAVGRGDRPLVLLMDISGSMEGERLDGAKESMRELLRSQRGDEEIGLYAYPGGSGGCDPGGFIVPVGPAMQKTDLLNAVDALASNGGTPTGEALQALVAQLEADGRTGASIVLVSDGESNCDIDPCEMARQIRNRGFEVSIPTVAFNISEAGRSELQCIADATDSPSVEVEGDDQEELWDLIQELSVAEVEVETVTPTVAQEDSTVEIEVTVRNPSARDLKAIRVSVVAEVGSGSGEAVVKPGVMIVGNLRPGAEATRVVTIDTTGLSGKITISALAWADNADSANAESRFSLVDESAISYEPGELLEGSELGALGDGFAGAEAASCEAGVAESVIGAATGVGEGRSLACLSASTRDLAEVKDGGPPSQVAQLAADGAAPDVVTVSVGANDVGLAPLVERCREEDCAADDPGLENAIRVAQEIDLTSVYELVAADLAASAPADEPPTVVVTAYPQLFPDLGGKGCGEQYSADEILAFNALVSTLNGAASQAATAAQGDGYPVYFADGTADALTEWSDLTLCSTGDQGVSVGREGLALTSAGARAMGKALARWSQGRGKADLPAKPTPARGQTAPAAGRHFLSGFFEPTVNITMDARPVASFADIDVTQADRRPAAAKPGQELRVRGDGYAPGTTVTLMLYLERPVLLGTFAVEGSGEVDAVTTVPLDAPVGATQLALLGVTADGQSERLVSALGLEVPVPQNTALFLLGALALSFAAAILALISHRARRRKP
ncbi:MAG: VWA domain-containing protein, partial [Bifidobacteriaceae bacterium]|nr:VWA domain-containing protein [Bifidobacteriaceae bacterium]